MQEEEKIETLCFLCGKGGNVKLFTTTTLEKCKASSIIRKNAKIQYANIDVPETSEESVGYHTRPCYSNFNSIKAKFRNITSSEDVSEHVSNDDSLPDILSESSNAATLSTIDDDNSNSNMGSTSTDKSIDECDKRCIFCNKRYKRIDNRNTPLSFTTNYDSFDNIKSHATKWNDTVLLNKIDSLISNSFKISYHRYCKTSYNINSITKSKEKTDWHTTRDHYKVAFKKLCIFIEQFVIKEKQFCYVQFAIDLFKDFLLESYEDGNINKDIFCAKRIPDKLVTQFKKHIKIIAKPNVQKIIVPVGCDFAINIDCISDTDIVLRAALIVRKEICKIVPNTIGNNITVSDLIEGECSVPSHLSAFYTTLLAGFNYRRRKNERTCRLVKSFSSDAIHAVTNGSVKPSKQIALASTVKSLSNSKELIKILYQFGHICSYDVIEGLETEATYYITEKPQLSASDMILREGLHTSTAFDNFDCFIESSKSQTTMNDTVGTAVQDIVTEIPVESEAVENNSNSNSTSNKRRRSFKGILLDIPQYSKKPKWKVCYLIVPLNFYIRNSCDHSY